MNSKSFIMGFIRSHKAVCIVLLSIIMSALTLYLARDSYLPKPGITVSFHQKTSAPVHFALWYKTKESDEYTKEQLVVEKKAPREGVVSFELPITHLHQFRLDFQPVEDAELSLSKLKINDGEKDVPLSDLSAMAFIVPKDITVVKKGDTASWRCSRPVSKISPKKPVDISAASQFNWHIFLLTAWTALSGWFIILNVLSRVIGKHKTITESYLKRGDSKFKGGFQPHLEGLRGLAILLILFFHLGTTGVQSPITLNGGYLGVEIFLVLSGYLLALGFCRKHESILAFTQKKLLRIMVPVSALVILTLCTCTLCMDFEDLKTTSTNALYALLGCSNVSLAVDGAEYFSSDQAFNPLLHMWYVAITLQLYLLIYAGYLIIWHFPRRAKCLFLLAISVLSYVYGNCHELRASFVTEFDLPLWIKSEGAMYYSTLGRLWEPILGMSVLLLPSTGNKVIASVVSGVALLLIAACVWILPAHAMLITACSTALLIRYANAGIVSYLLQNKIVRFIGQISFSIYLVHMPLYVCYKCSTYTALNYTMAVVLLVGSIVLGWGAWWMVEKRKAPIWTLLLVWLSGMMLSHLLTSTNGLQKYWYKESNAFEYPKYTQWQEEKDPQLYVGLDINHLRYEYGWVRLVGGTREGWRSHKWMLRLGVTHKKPTFVLIGDSHAQHYIMGLDVLCRKHDIAGVYLGAIMVPFWNREEPERSKHYDFYREKAYAFVNWLKVQPSITHVCIAQTGSRFKTLDMDWDKNKLPKDETSNLPAFREFCVQIKKAGKEVAFFAPLPLFKEKSPLRYYRFLMRSGKKAEDVAYPATIYSKALYDKTYAKTIPYLKQLHQEKVCYVFWPHKFLFRNGVASMERDGELLYKDANHFTVNGSIAVIEAIGEEVVRVLKQNFNSAPLP